MAVIRAQKQSKAAFMTNTSSCNIRNMQEETQTLH